MYELEWTRYSKEDNEQPDGSQKNFVNKAPLHNKMEQGFFCIYYYIDRDPETSFLQFHRNDLVGIERRQLFAHEFCGVGEIFVDPVLDDSDGCVDLKAEKNFVLGFQRIGLTFDPDFFAEQVPEELCDAFIQVRVATDQMKAFEQLPMLIDMLEKQVDGRDIIRNKDLIHIFIRFFDGLVNYFDGIVVQFFQHVDFVLVMDIESASVKVGPVGNVADGDGLYLVVLQNEADEGILQ